MTKGKTNGSSSGSNNNNNNKPTIVEKDADAPFELPMSVVTRTIKAAVPEGTTIARDSRLAIARSGMPSIAPSRTHTRARFFRATFARFSVADTASDCDGPSFSRPPRLYSSLQPACL